VAKSTQPAKRHRQSLKKRTRNYSYRSRLKTHLKNARLAIINDAEDKDELVNRACRELDRMATRGVIHKNNASRRKSRLRKALRGEVKLDESIFEMGEEEIAEEERVAEEEEVTAEEEPEVSEGSGEE
jgi:small subunit ribosomal protein S20